MVSGQVLVVKGKAEFADKVQCCARGGTESGYVPGVRRDFRFDQDDMEWRVSLDHYGFQRL